MSWVLIVACILIGFAIILVEIIFIPGTTIVGFLGLAVLSVGVFFSYDGYGALAGNITLAATITSGGIFAYLVYKYRLWTLFSLNDSLKSTKNDKFENLTIGDVGITRSALRPTGSVEFNHIEKEVEATNGYINSGQKVKIVQMDKYRIFVEEINTNE